MKLPTKHTVESNWQEVQRERKKENKEEKACRDEKNVRCRSGRIKSAKRLGQNWGKIGLFHG